MCVWGGGGVQREIKVEKKLFLSNRFPESNLSR